MDKQTSTPVVAGGSAIRTVGVFPSHSHVVSTVFGGKRQYSPVTPDDASKAALRRVHLTRLVQMYNDSGPKRPALYVDNEAEYEDLAELSREFTIVRADTEAMYLQSLRLLGRLSFAKLD